MGDDSEGRELSQPIYFSKTSFGQLFVHDTGKFRVPEDTTLEGEKGPVKAFPSALEGEDRSASKHSKGGGIKSAF